MLDTTATSTYTVLTGRANEYRTWSSTVVSEKRRCVIYHQPASSMNHSRISSVTQCLWNSISLWTQKTTPMCHTWEPADSSFNSKNIPCRGRASFTKTSKANCVSLFVPEAMRNYKKSQAINIYVQPYRGVKKIYSHAGQYAKITYKMSLSLSKIFSIQRFSWNSTNDYIFFLK